ncbi:glycosyltransferase family 1 protein [Limnohabitans sp. DM1]|uniref:glycosyltransferase family 4 protein n=1 Tax=Limnohabitans sp. DM1 TaxID=1597955 RepID=UPI000AC47BF9|nr:glycosyltransferase family 1 protein [Limnohabitans sp. DM1]
MKVGFGTTVWGRGLANHQLDGIGYYTQEVFRRLDLDHVQLRPVVFGNAGAEQIDGHQTIRLGRYSISAALAAVTDVPFAGSSLLAKHVDIFHATDHYTPKLKGVPVVATLMDAIPLSHPQWVSSRLRGLKNWLWRTSGHWADQVITISDFSRTEVAKHFRIPESRITVTPLGVDDRYFERLSGDAAEAVLGKYGVPDRFFVFVGTLQPRKNVERIVQAHEALPAALRAQCPLLIVGRNGWGCDDLVAKLNACTADGPVRWLQSVNDFEKRVLMQRSTALVFPSLFEGFGLPVLEGFASQTPVITSNSTSLPEVAADAAWMLDPLDVHAMADAMATLATDQALARDFAAKGLARARAFTWDACAAQTLKVYERVLSRA